MFSYCYYCQGLEDVNRPPQTWDPHPCLSTPLQMRHGNLAPAWALSNKFLFLALSLTLPLVRPQIYTTEQASGKSDSTTGSLCLDLSPGYTLDIFHSLAILGAADRCCYQYLMQEPAWPAILRSHWKMTFFLEKALAVLGLTLGSFLCMGQASFCFYLTITMDAIPRVIAIQVHQRWLNTVIKPRKEHRRKVCCVYSWVSH